MDRESVKLFTLADSSRQDFLTKVLNPEQRGTSLISEIKGKSPETYEAVRNFHRGLPTERVGITMQGLKDVAEQKLRVIRASM